MPLWDNLPSVPDERHAVPRKCASEMCIRDRPYIDQVELILVMTVEPGFGGQKFMADQMPKVAAIRKLINERNPACELEVDGGVAPDTCQTCIDADVYKRQLLPCFFRAIT